MQKALCWKDIQYKHIVNNAAFEMKLQLVIAYLQLLITTDNYCRTVKVQLK